MTDFIELKNNATRLIGRQIGLWAWQGFEIASSFVLPWIVAGEMSPVQPVEAELAETKQKLIQVKNELETITKMQQGQVVAQQVAGAQHQPVIQVQVNNQNQIQNNVVVGAQNPGRLTRLKDFIYNSVHFSAKATKFLLITAPTSIGLGLFRGVKWVDGTISSTLGAIDGALNRRFKGIPGYRLLTWYPLRLGNWEHAYKQTRNYMLLVNPLWQRFATPFLKKHFFFDDMAKAVSSYVAPYADEGVQIVDKAVIGFLSTIYSSAKDFGLSSFEKSFVGTWYGSKPIQTPVYNTFVTISDYFTPIKVSTIQLEGAAERHIELLKSGATQAIDKLSSMNGHIRGYAEPLMTLVGCMMNDMYRYGNCVFNTERGFGPCTQSAFTHAYYDYAVPVGNYIYTNGLVPLSHLASRYALNPIMQFLQRNCVTGPMFYFGDCVVNGNSGYLMQTGSMLKQATTVSLSANTCPVDTMIVSGMQNCSSNAMQYMYVDYAQPFMGALWNFGSSIINGVTDGIYNCGETVITGARDGIYNGVTGLVALAAANPGTTVAISVAIPTVLFAAYGASVAYQRCMKPGLQHVQVHGVAPQQANLNVNI